MCAATTGDVRAVTGREALAFAAFATEHAERFGGRALAVAPGGGDA
jgi:hypothetical protein